MPEDENKPTLERLKQELRKEYPIDGGDEKKVKRRAKEKKLKFIVIGIALLLIIGGVAAIYLMNNTRERSVPDFLSKTEKEDWLHKEVNNKKVFLYINSKLTVDEDKNVRLNMANPPYCAFVAKVEIKDKDDNTVYYTSDMIKPEQSIEKVQLLKVPEKNGTRKISINYSFYDKSSKTVMAKHSIDGTLVME